VEPPMNVTLKKGDGSKHGDNLKPGEWGITEDGHVMVRCGHAEHSDGLPRLGIICYAAGTGSEAIKRNWKIAADGRVTPSILFKDDICGWHVFATLEGWAG